MSFSPWVDLGLLLIFLVTTALFVFLQYTDIEPALELDTNTNEPVTSRWFYPPRLLRQCGHSWGQAKWLYWSCKYASVVLCVAIYMSLLPLRPNWTLLISLTFLAFFFCDLWLLLQRRSRRNAIANSLELLVSLLVAFLRSGFTLTQALKQSGQFGLDRRNPLAIELDLMSAELDAGSDRNRAFSRLAERTGVGALERLSAVIQAGVSIGTPVVQALENQLEVLRQQQRQQDLALINRKSLELLFPMVLVCFPMFSVLVYFPAGVKLMEVFSLLGQIF